MVCRFHPQRQDQFIGSRRKIHRLLQRQQEQEGKVSNGFDGGILRQEAQ